MVLTERAPGGGSSTQKCPCVIWPCIGNVGGIRSREVAMKVLYNLVCGL